VGGDEFRQPENGRRKQYSGLDGGVADIYIGYTLRAGMAQAAAATGKIVSLRRINRANNHPAAKKAVRIYHPN